MGIARATYLLRFDDLCPTMSKERFDRFMNIVKRHRIRPILDIAVRRFEAFSRLQHDLAEAKGKLAERESIDRAKRILMDSRGLTEPQAYAEMRNHAMQSGKRIADIADAVITAQKLMGGGR